MKVGNARRSRYNNAMPRVSYNQRRPKTPSQRFEALLAEAEKRFGPRSRELQFTLLARTNPVPETKENGPNGCVVYYFDQAASDPERLCFQLAHETIHFLSGGLKRSARNIEEGLAVWFSLNNSQLLDSNYKVRARVSLTALFKKALDLFCKLNPSDDSIKMLRAEASNLDDVTPELLVKVFSASTALAENLCERVSEEMQDRLK